MRTAAELRALVENAITALPLPPHPDRLYQPIRYALTLGGKRLRPVMMLMAYNLWQDNPQSILPQALAMEVYHNFTLLHDDVMDHASMRRGQPCVHIKWDVNTAILAGDAMLALAYQLYGTSRGLDTFHQATIGVCEGQQYDMDYETATHVSEDDYMDMIQLKTALLFACSLKIGAQLADAPDVDAQALYQFGIQLGLAFQLQDDYLDVYADPHSFGKQIGGDIIEGKRTWLLIKACSIADARQRTVLLDCINNSQTPPEEKIRTVIALYNQLNIPALCRVRIEQLFGQALQSLQQINLPEQRRAPLTQLAEHILRRDK